jgi:peptidoglycan/LPS O-acetylase OafA/YrhL
MTIERDNLEALTGLRFVAAFTIVLGHVYQPWLEVTAIGMPLFFTLSGFIIHYVYAEAFAGGWRRATREFAVARFSRIYPLYMALLGYMLLRSPMGDALTHSPNLPALSAYLFAYWTWYPFLVDGRSVLDWYYHISWSVSTEIFFYICYALVFYRLAWVRSAKNCLVILVMFCVIAYLCFFGLFMTRDIWEPAFLHAFPQYVSRVDNFDSSFYRWLLYVSPYCRLPEFIGGVLTCQLYLLVRRQPRLVEQLRPGVTAAAAIGTIAVLFAQFRYFGGHDPWLAVTHFSYGAFIVNLHMNFLFAPACYALIFALALGGSALSRTLASRPACFLGDISYSTYLSHPITDRILLHTGVEIGSALPYLVVMLAIIYALSWALYSLVEVPAKRWLRQLLSPRRLVVVSPTGGN